MVTRHCGDHIIRYINVKSLCCTRESNIILYVTYTLIKISKTNVQMPFDNHLIHAFGLDLFSTGPTALRICCLYLYLPTHS